MEAARVNHYLHDGHCKTVKVHSALDKQRLSNAMCTPAATEPRHAHPHIYTHTHTRTHTHTAMQYTLMEEHTKRERETHNHTYTHTDTNANTRSSKYIMYVSAQTQS